MVLVSQRPFPNTSRQSAPQQGNSFANGFNDPRNIGNYDSGEIAPSGRYATRYPTNIASNTSGFNLPEMADNPKNLFYGSGNGTFPSSGSASDYLIYNKFFSNLLFPHSKLDVREELEPLYNNSGTVYSGKGRQMSGCGNNAPSSGSSIDYSLNNPYKDFNDKFYNEENREDNQQIKTLSGHGTNAPSSASSIDYSLNNPYKDFKDTFNGEGIEEDQIKVLSGGKIDLVDFINRVSRGMQKLPELMENVPDIVNKTSNVIETIQELRKALKGKKTASKKVMEDISEPEEEEKPKKTKKKRGRKSKKMTGKGYMTHQA
jgi:hypothetical protein